MKRKGDKKVKEIIFKKYEIDKKPIGYGFFAKVYRGYDLQKERGVAIKITRDLKRAYREVKAMKRFGRSEYLPVLYDFMRKNNKAYIVMEYIDGKNLWEEFIARGKLCDEKFSIQILMNVLKALHTLHERGYAHTDVKAKNIIIVDKDPQKIKIIDFNSTRYISKRIKIQRDLRSAAKLFVYLTNGAVYEKEKIYNPKFQNKKLKPVILKALNKQYNSAQEFLDALSELQELQGHHT